MADDHLSEAACLLEQGATYRRRVGLKPTHGRPIRSSPASSRVRFAIYFGDAPIYHFDLEGRWQRAFVDGTHFLKALDGDRPVHRPGARRAEPGSEAQDAWTHAAASDFDVQVRSTALELIGDLDAREARRIEPSSQRAIAPRAESSVSSWNGSPAGTRPPGSPIASDTSRPTARMPFLPPECPNAVVLQATLGHTAQFGVRPCSVRRIPTGVRPTNSVSMSAKSPRSGAAASCKAARSFSAEVTFCWACPPAT